ncbi:glycosyltransferase family 2 protein [Pelagibacterales bacterium SAG-MED47]|nr:glycosyltransferase family 2 protein [Pelagibacterales bacterium SAG-MED47]
MKPKISIIIRTKNEERWISKCIDAIQTQKFKNFEIIIVDNKSTDKTIKKAKLCGVRKIISIENYLPGLALNTGIRKSSGDFIVCLSAHCIPKNNSWLTELLKNFKDEKVAGVYGRQIPMEFSKDADKRDLFLVFGLDKKIQIKDSFFHNANSMIRKKIWNKINFDNKISNIEDRIWGQEVIKKKYKLIYEPEASVYHYHGIHQDGNLTRLKNVVNIIQSQDKNFSQGNIDPNSLNIVALIPSKGKPKKFKKDNLLLYTLNAAKKSKYIKKIIVSTDNYETKKLSINEGAECPFIRPKKLSSEKINLEEVQKFSLKELEKKKIIPDLIIHLEETFPFRDSGLIDEIIETLLKNGHDTVIAAKEENGWLWKENNKKVFLRLDEGDVPRKYKKKSYIGLHGVCCATYPEYLRKGSLLGENVGLFPIKNNLSSLEIRDVKSHKKFYQFLKKNK